MKSKNTGFTLIELIIYIALMTVLLLVLTEILYSLVAVKLESEATSAVEQDGRFLMARINYDIGQMLSTDVITSPLTLGGSSNTLSFTVNGQPISYTLVSTDLRLNDGSGDLNLNSSETGISIIGPSQLFQKIGNPGGKESIKVVFRLTSRTRRPTGFEVRDLTTTIGRR